MLPWDSAQLGLGKSCAQENHSFSRAASWSQCDRQERVMQPFVSFSSRRKCLAHYQDSAIMSSEERPITGEETEERLRSLAADYEARMNDIAALVAGAPD